MSDDLEDALGELLCVCCCNETVCCSLCNLFSSCGDSIVNILSIMCTEIGKLLFNAGQGIVDMMTPDLSSFDNIIPLIHKTLTCMVNNMKEFISTTISSIGEHIFSPIIEKINNISDIFAAPANSVNNGFNNSSVDLIIIMDTDDNNKKESQQPISTYQYNQNNNKVKYNKSKSQKLKSIKKKLTNIKKEFIQLINSLRKKILLSKEEINNLPITSKKEIVQLRRCDSNERLSQFLLPKKIHNNRSLRII